MANQNWIWIVLAVIAVVLVANGTINLGGLGGQEAAAPSKTVVYPSTLTTSVTLNTKNALASTDTNANVSYYVFDKAGNYVTGGTTSAGTASITLNYLGDYDLLTFSDSAYYPAETTFSVASGEAQKTINLALNAVSNATIKAMRNPVDLTANISVGIGQSVAFDVLYQVTSTASAVNKPVVVIDVNQTSVQDVTLGGMSKVTCPQRLSISAGRKLYCFQDTTLLSTEGIRTKSGTIVFSSAITPSTADTLTAEVIDTQMFTDPNFASKGRSGFREGTENTNTNAQVGATDSNVGTLGFLG